MYNWSQSATDCRHHYVLYSIFTSNQWAAISATPDIDGSKQACNFYYCDIEIIAFSSTSSYYCIVTSDVNP